MYVLSAKQRRLERRNRRDRQKRSDVWMKKLAHVAQFARTYITEDANSIITKTQVYDAFLKQYSDSRFPDFYTKDKFPPISKFEFTELLQIALHNLNIHVEQSHTTHRGRDLKTWKNIKLRANDTP